MSRRTAESNKAILAAWNKEQELVQEGKGTREWTPQQQQDILDKGKAYDEDGVSFQGQHMKSVEKYPEYQGDPENIQFLMPHTNVFEVAATVCIKGDNVLSSIPEDFAAYRHVLCYCAAGPPCISRNT